MPLVGDTATIDTMDDYETDDEMLIPKPEKVPSSSEVEQEEEEEEHRVLSTIGGSVHSRHPWFKKWNAEGRNVADLLPEQYPEGYDPKRNECK